MNTLSKATVLLLFLALSIAGCKKNDDDPELPAIETFKAAIVGDWQSVGPEFDDQSQSYGFRTLNLTETTWSITVERFADSAMSIPLFTLDFEGPYEITEESEMLSGSYNGTFQFASKHFTTFIDPVNLGLENCGLTVGVKKDVSNQDCAWLESIEHCPADYDLISFENEQLIPGMRTGNMCEPTGRPTEKGFPMARI